MSASMASYVLFVKQLPTGRDVGYLEGECDGKNVSIISPISRELNRLNASVGAVVGVNDDGAVVDGADDDGDWLVDGNCVVIARPISRSLNALIQLETSIVTLVGAGVGRLSNSVVVVVSLSGALSFGRSNCTEDVPVESLTSPPPPVLFEFVVAVADSLVESDIPPFASDSERALFRLLIVVPTAYPTDAISTATAMTATAMINSVLFRPRRRWR